MAKKNFVFDPLSTAIDRVWAGNASDDSDRFNNYYDYYFSGEDIKVFIDGLFDPADELDVASFAYSVRQEKQPIYGFWSYNYDTVMLGTRIISGEITLYTRGPNRMATFLQKAALNRETSAKNRRESMANPSNAIISKLTPGSFRSEDEKNIQKYWGYSKLDRVTVDPNVDGKNIFSAHPPFNFIVLYGVEETALTPFTAGFSKDVIIEDNLDRMIYSDANQRTVRADEIGAGMKTVLQQVNLMNVSTGFSPGGQPIVESYQFIARDFYHTSVDMSFIKNMVASNASDVDTEVYDSRPSVSTPNNSNSGGNLGRRVGNPGNSVR